MNRLEESGYIQYDVGLSVVDDAVREAGLAFLTATAGVSPPTILEAYVLPQFSGIEFAYIAIDAVYVLTRGGYQVARNETDYPLFITIHELDLADWERFFERFGDSNGPTAPVTRQNRWAATDRSRTVCADRCGDHRRAASHPPLGNRYVRARALRDLRVGTGYPRPDVRRPRNRGRLLPGLYGSSSVTSTRVSSVRHR